MKHESQDPPIWLSFVWCVGGTLALLPSFALFLCEEAATKIREWDHGLTEWCHSQRAAWKLFTRLGDGWLYAAAYLWLQYDGWKAEANAIASSVLLAWGICSVLKVLVRRQRPRELKGAQNTDEWLRAWYKYRTTAYRRSFPSQHAACAVAFAVALWPNPGAIALAAVICVSRVAVGAHYLGDVVAGVAVGLIAGRLG